MTYLSQEFNPYNAKHVRAWKHLEEHGCWPEEFADWIHKEGITIDNGWFIGVLFKMANAWANSIIEEFDNG